MEPTAKPLAIIKAVVNVVFGRKYEMYDQVLIPSYIEVFYHPSDEPELGCLIPFLKEQVEKALEARLGAANRTPAWRGWLKPKPVLRGGSRWTIRFLASQDGAPQPGEIRVVTRLNADEPIVLSGCATVLTQQTGCATTLSPNAAGGTADPVLATIRYRDDAGDHTYLMTKPEISGGRRDPEYWVDMPFETHTDVSREHIRLRVTPGSALEVMDVSRGGVTIEGQPVSPKNSWRPVPDKATLVLAGCVRLDIRKEAA